MVENRTDEIVSNVFKIVFKLNCSNSFSIYWAGGAEQRSWRHVHSIVSSSKNLSYSISLFQAKINMLLLFYFFTCKNFIQ